MSFQDKVQTLINQCENESDTDLAQYLQSCLDTWKKAVRARDKWYNYHPWGSREIELRL